MKWGWNHLSIPKLQRCNRWSLGMDMLFHPTFYNGCNYLFILGKRLIHVSIRGLRLYHGDEQKVDSHWCVSGVTGSSCHPGYTYTDTLIIEMKMSSLWRNFRHWLHWMLSNDNLLCSQLQISVQPGTIISSKWRFMIKIQLFRTSWCFIQWWQYACVSIINVSRPK